MFCLVGLRAFIYSTIFLSFGTLKKVIRINCLKRTPKSSMIMLIFVTTNYRVSYMDMVVFKRLIRYIATVSFFQRPVFLWETTCSQKKLTLVSEDTGCIISSLNFYHIFMGHTIYRQQEKNMLTLTYCNRPRD